MTEKSILQLMDLLSERSNDSKLGDEFWAENQEVASALASRLSITRCKPYCSPFACSMAPGTLIMVTFPGI